MAQLLPITGIGIGLGLDLYARSVCQGVLLPKIDKWKLIIGVLLFGLFEELLLGMGYFLSQWMHMTNLADRGDEINILLSMLIFAFIGIKMIQVAIKNEDVEETRREEGYMIKSLYLMALRIGLFTFLSGIGLGFLLLPSAVMLLIPMLFGILGVGVGLVSGYLYGYRQKTKAYSIGGSILLLMVACIFGFYLM